MIDTNAFAGTEPTLQERTSSGLRVTYGALLVYTSLAVLVPAHVLSLTVHKARLYHFGWVICCYLTVLLLATGRAKLGNPFKPAVPLLILLGYLALSQMWSFDPAVTRLYAFYSLLFPVVFMSSAIWARNSDTHVVSAYFVALLMVMFYLIARSVVTVGMLVDANLGAVRSGYGYVFVVSVPMLVWRAVVHPTPWRHILLAVVVLLAAVIGSRSALLLLPAVFIASVVSNSITRASRTRALILMGTVASLGGAAALLAGPMRNGVGEAVARFSSSTTSFDISANVESELNVSSYLQRDVDRRLQAFVALSSFLEHPIIGAGYMSTLAKTGEYYGRDISAHGLPFTLLGETGLIGCALFGWLILGFFTRVRKHIRMAASPDEQSFWRSVRLAMLAMLLFGLFHQVHQDPSFYIVLGWGYAGLGRSA